MSYNSLKNVRQEKGISQSELAEKIGVSRQMIWGYESGKYDISAEILAKLSNILDVDAKYIINGKKSDKNGFGDGINKEEMVESIKITEEFFRNYNFEREMMSKIAVELYEFMIEYDKIQKDGGDISSLKKVIDDKIAVGLAAKCFTDVKKM